MNRTLSRRAMLAGMAGLVAYGVPRPAAAAYLRRATTRQDAMIHPRTDWAGDGRLPTGPIDVEQVSFLVVHHTLIPGNGYSEDDVPRLLREIFDYHTGPEKGWPDIAYNFVVDRFGGIWETRFGSLDGPVEGSETGGNQGWSQSCCFLGDLTSGPPTPEAAASMAQLAAGLAQRYDLDTEPGATVTLTSRGSTRYAAGETMTVPILSAHLDVSLTACPGEAGYAWVQNTLPELVGSRVAPSTTTEAPTTTEPPTTTEAPTTTAPASTTEAEATTTDPIDGAPGEDSDGSLPFGEETAQPDTGVGQVKDRPIEIFVGAGLALAGAGLGVMWLAGRDRKDAEPALAVPGDERADGNIDVNSRLGLEGDDTGDEYPAIDAPGDAPSASDVGDDEPVDGSDHHHLDDAEPDDEWSTDSSLDDSFDPTIAGAAASAAVAGTAALRPDAAVTNADTPDVEVSDSEPSIPVTSTESPSGAAQELISITTPAVRPAPLQGPQRVWWAVDSTAPRAVHEAVESMIVDVHRHASIRPDAPAEDRAQWSHFDGLLAARGRGHRAVIVAVRSDAVFILRSSPLAIEVTRPDGAVKRDETRDALHVFRRDVDAVTAFFDPDEPPVIEVASR